MCVIWVPINIVRTDQESDCPRRIREHGSCSGVRGLKGPTIGSLCHKCNCIRVREADLKCHMTR